MTKLIKPIAIEKCERRLEEAHEALDECRSASFYDDFEKYWTRFLMSAGSVINILETSAGKTPQGRQWYGAKRNEGRKDELVRYMYQARNAEEHGIDPITSLTPPKWSFSDSNLGISISDPAVSKDGKTIFLRANHAPLTPKLTARHTPAKLLLRTVVDERYNQSFEPPETHLGVRIVADGAPTPMQAAQLYISYLADLTTEAAELEARS